MHSGKRETAGPELVLSVTRTVWSKWATPDFEVYTSAKANPTSRTLRSLGLIRSHHDFKIVWQPTFVDEMLG